MDADGMTETPTRSELDAGYAAMARDEAHETEALEWIEGLIGDVAQDSH